MMAQYYIQKILKILLNILSVYATWWKFQVLYGCCSFKENATTLFSLYSDSFSCMHNKHNINANKTKFQWMPFYICQTKINKWCLYQRSKLKSILCVLLSEASSNKMYKEAVLEQSSDLCWNNIVDESSLKAFTKTITIKRCCLFWWNLLKLI